MHFHGTFLKFRSMEKASSDHNWVSDEQGQNVSEKPLEKGWLEGVCLQAREALAACVQADLPVSEGPWYVFCVWCAIGFVDNADYVDYVEVTVR